MGERLSRTIRRKVRRTAKGTDDAPRANIVGTESKDRAESSEK
jgi:hypothetical protein